MILGNFRLCALGVMLAGLSVPVWAGAPARPEAPRAAIDCDARAPSRRVELPFPLDLRPAESRRDAPPPRLSDAPHPYRELGRQRASLAAPAVPGAFRPDRLSRAAEFG